MTLSVNEFLALQFVLKKVSLIDLLTNAQNGYDTNDEEENAVACYDAIMTYLK